MESFENFESSATESTPESGPLSVESSKESREKSRKAGEKAIAQISRSRKDESIAHTQDLLLARVIRRILQGDDSQGVLTLLLDIRASQVPAHMSIALMSLVSLEAREEILEYYHRINTFPVVPKREEVVKFSESILHPNEKNTINAWIELVFIVLIESPSTVRTTALYHMLNAPESSMVDSVSQVLSLFCITQNITPTKGIVAYAQFIVVEINRRLRAVELADIENGGTTRL
jgi:hypothetical protein